MKDRKKLFISTLLLFIMIVSVWADASREYYQKGEEYLSSGNYEKAREYFRKAYKLDKKFTKPYRRLIDSYFDEKNLNGFWKEAETFLKEGPLDVDLKAYIFNKMALLKAQNGDFSKAEELIKKAIQLTTKDKDREIYEETAKKVKSLKLKYIDEEYKKAEAFYNAGDRDKALNLLRKLSRLYPGYKEVASLYLKITEEQAKEKLQKKLDELESKANSLESQKKWEEANGLWQQIVFMAANKMNGYKEKYEGFKRRWKNWREEEERKKREAEQARKKKEEYEKLVRTLKDLLRDEEWRKALNVIESLKKIAPDENYKWEKYERFAKSNLKVLANIREGLRLVKEKQYKRAISYLEKVFKKNKSFKIIRALAIAYYNNKDYQKVVALLDKPLQKVKYINDDILDLYLIMANSCINIGDTVKARRYLDKYINYRKSDEKAKLTMVKLLIKLKDYKKAEALLKESAVISGSNWKIFELYKKLYEESDNFDGLATVYRKMIVSIGDPKDKNYRKLCYELGKLYYQKKQFADAYLYFSKALQKMPPSEKKLYSDITKMYRYTLYLRYKIYVQVIIGFVLIFVIKFTYSAIIVPLMISMKSGRKQKLKDKIRDWKISGDYKKIISAAEELIKKYPLEVNEAKTIRTALAEAYLKTGNPDKAEVEAKKVLELDRMYKTAHHVLAEVHMQRKEYPQVINRCRMIFDFDITDAKAHKLFQQAFLAMDKKDDLLMEYDDMLKTNEDNIGLRNIYLKLQSELLD